MSVKGCSDILPTLGELAGATVPANVDGISILPELLGAEVVGRPQQAHAYLYWEFRGQTAVRWGPWKAIRPGPQRDWELYHLEQDPGEEHDLAAAHPQRVARAEAIVATAHEPVRPGTYADRADHERDRWAKWGTSRKARGQRGD